MLQDQTELISRADKTTAGRHKSTFPENSAEIYFQLWSCSNSAKLTSYVDIKVPGDVEFVIPLMKYTDLLSISGSLDATKATGLDGITANILKKSTLYVIGGQNYFFKRFNFYHIY